MAFKPYPEQVEAANKMKVGKILYGDVGSGKTVTSLLFYKKWYSNYPLVVITTAKKRDTHDWEDEAAMLDLEIESVDSWNNIGKYTKDKNKFFIFDEQRVIGSGSWSRNFIKISSRNKWILLTGTPGTTWMDYVPVFIANGFYRNKTDFIDQHVEYDRFTKYPSIKRYHNVQKLQRNRAAVLVRMTVERHTRRHKHYIECGYDKELYSKVQMERFNFLEDKPIETASEYVQLLRRVVSTSVERVHEAGWQIYKNPKAIIFYNYDYELEILRDLCEFVGRPTAEWNGHKHEEIPDTDTWIYLVQYTAGAEGWNCTETDRIIFYSPNYSYKVVEQAEGRVDRLNTKFTDLHYIYLYSKSNVDKAVFKAIQTGKTFSESAWVKKRGGA